MKRAAIAVLLVAGACGKTQETPSSAASCATAAKSAVETMVKRAKDRIASSPMPEDIRAKMEERTNKLDELRPRFVALITNRCTDDKWPADVVNCYGKAAGVEDMRACRGKLAQELQNKLMREEMDLMAGAMGPPGFGPSAGAGMEPGGPKRLSPERTQVERHLSVVERQIAEATAKVDAAKTDAERAAARTELTKLEASAATLRAQLMTPSLGSAMGSGSAGSGSAGSAVAP
jgi:hypothetical protein